jgi:hypothetical protein
MAEDSANKENQTQAEQKPSESLVVVRNVNGTTREMLRSEKGTFIRKPKPPIPTIEFVRKERKILNSLSKTKEGLTEHEQAFLNILRIAQCEDDDPKSKMAAVKAYEILMRRALGKEAPSEQELDKLTQQPVRSIIVFAPEIMHPEIVKEKTQTKIDDKPAFAEVTSVETNPK